MNEAIGVDLKLIKLCYISVLPLYLYYRTKVNILLHTYIALTFAYPLIALDAGALGLSLILLLLMFVLYINIDELKKLSSSRKNFLDEFHLKVYDHIALVVYIVFLINYV